MAGLMLDPAPELRTPIPTGSVLCRARVHATGRDTDVDGTTMDPFENYLIQLWDTTTETPANIVRTRSDYGAMRRSH
ncbi:hypothetical protein AB0L13_45355 [Saccharopolyspora shandongensis]|uniref:hypothetical protein n=1 Tax=Saccharopolyspora shandongensis TaxID=418495 RepID=UPI00343900F6